MKSFRCPEAQFLFMSTHSRLHLHRPLKCTFRITFLVLPKWALTNHNHIHKTPQEPGFPCTLVLISPLGDHQDEPRQALNLHRTRCIFALPGLESKLMVPVWDAERMQQALLNSIYWISVSSSVILQASEENTWSGVSWAELFMLEKPNWKSCFYLTASHFHSLEHQKYGFTLTNDSLNWTDNSGSAASPHPPALQWVRMPAITVRPPTTRGYWTKS